MFFRDNDTRLDTIVFFARMEFYAIQEYVKKSFRNKVILDIIILIKAHEMEKSVTGPKIYRPNIQKLMTSECKMILQELEPYLVLPPVDPSFDWNCGIFIFIKMWSAAEYFLNGSIVVLLRN